MGEITSRYDELQKAGAEWLAASVNYLPNLLGAVLLVIAGWLVARLARTASAAIAKTAVRTIERIVGSEQRTALRLPSRIPKIVGDLTFWIIILFFVTAAADTARLAMLSGWLVRLVAYMPTLVAGAAVVFVGYLASTFVRDVVASASGSAGFAQSEFLGKVAQAAAFLMGLVIALDQIGIDVSFLVTILAISLAALLGGLSLAFGIGARTFVGNLIGSRDIQRVFRQGEIIRLGNVQGEVLEITPTSIVIATDKGRAALPAHLFSEQMSEVLLPEEDP